MSSPPGPSPCATYAARVASSRSIVRRCSITSVLSCETNSEWVILGDLDVGDPVTSAELPMRSDYSGVLRDTDVGRTVAVCGWVHRRREHGEHLAFIDVRDHTGLVQCVVDGAHDLRSEYVVRVVGTVRLRPEGTENATLATGSIEIGDCTVEILNTAEPPPFPL